MKFFQIKGGLPHVLGYNYIVALTLSSTKDRGATAQLVVFHFFSGVLVSCLVVGLVVFNIFL